MSKRQAVEDKLLAELDALIGSTPGLSARGPQAPVIEEPAPRPPEETGASERPALELLPERRAAPPPERRLTILVAEDNKDYRKIVAYLLSDNGYDVVQAGDGVEGLKLAREKHPDLALLDFEMPGMNGYELVQELRRLEETRAMPIVMLTGARHRKNLHSLDMPIEALLEKPIGNNELLDAISHAARLAPARPPALAPVSPPAPAEPQRPADEPLPDLEAAESGGEGEQELLLEDQVKERDDEPGLDILANDSPLVNRINRLLVRAVELGASDIHIEPQEHEVVIRLRRDGSLQRVDRLPRALAPQLAARIKIMANLVITERRRPQDGQVRAMIKGNKVEFRVSTLPSLHGEKVVMRILGGAKLKGSVEELGLRPRDLDVVRRALETPHGLLLVTGPTGSGKTTTLYTMMRVLNQPDVNIMTVEDPVEYELEGITQVPVRADLGLTFEKVLRSFLRQDPDVMLVGEIRDLETADIAVKAAITGHLVLSTLHTNSAAAAVARLAHMGLAPYLIADSVKLIIAQRLVRTLCASCKRAAEPSPERTSMLLPEELSELKQVFEPAGCASCHQTGYAGRQALMEIMEVRTLEIRQIILAGGGGDRISRRAAEEGLVSLRRSAFEALLAGQTSLEEALGVMLGE